MKKNIFVLVLGMIVMAGCVIYVPVDEGGQPYGGDYYEETYPDQMDTSYFYDYLSPHGMWVQLPTYGYVWLPERVGYGWRPYTNGRWVWSDFGWTWVSHYSWGWVPFHYGRWGWDRYLGWYWVPGTDWGPAWVSWRTGNLYIGWAPIPPDARFIPRVGINSLPYTLHYGSWIFVEYTYFLNPRINRYMLPVERNLTLINYSALRTEILVRNNRIMNTGLDVDYVRRMTRQTISRYQLAPAARPGQSRVSGDRVEIYNPVLKTNESARPKTVVRREEAQGRITRTTLREPLEPAESPEKRLQDVQSQEVKRLEESQERELQQILSRKKKEESNAKSPEEKQKIDKEYAQRVEKVKQSHEKEKAEIKSRHKKEEEQTKKKKIKK
jgi:hypothetical protein